MRPAAYLGCRMEIGMQKLRTHWVEMIATSVTAALVAFAVTVMAGFTHG
jgi:hypothetical protein